MRVDSQVIELLGRNRLTNEILLAGLEVAHPARDRGIDLIAYSDLENNVSKFAARPIQMKAASVRSFGIDRKYKKFPNLLIAFVWNLGNAPEKVETYALTHQEVEAVVARVWPNESESQKKGIFVTTKPSVKLCKELEQFRMTPARWRERIAEGK